MSIVIAILFIFGIVKLLQALARGAQRAVDTRTPNNNPSMNMRERRIDSAVNRCNECLYELRSSESIGQFMYNWTCLQTASIELQDLSASIFVSPFLKAQRNDVLAEMDSLQGEKFQWYLRNAVDRQTKHTVKALKTTYRNSQTYKQQEFDRFCNELQANMTYFNDETKDFVGKCVEEVQYAFNGTSRSLPFHNDAADYERSLLTPSLRYDILRRDGFRCTICGRGQEDGVKLHVDHIRPVSKGGRTIPENLRTLCQDCNLGKSDSYIEGGYN